MQQLLMLTSMALGLTVTATADTLMDTIKTVETKLGARVGVAILDIETNKRWQHRADERFPMNSTFKTLACGALLARVDVGTETLVRRVTFSDSDLVTYSPVSKNHTGDKGMSLGDACDATMVYSDNTAANLVVDALGGPTAVTDFLRTIGDETTRLDRWETELNSAVPGDPRDTSTPNAMLETYRKLVLGDVLTPAARQQLKHWLLNIKVSGPLIRAGLPDNWTVGDRTGAGGYGSRGNVAILWPPKRQPILVAIYITETEAPMKARNAAIAEIGAALAHTIEAD